MQLLPERGLNEAECWTKEREDNEQEHSGLVTIFRGEKNLRGDTDAEFIAAIRRGRDGEPVPKQKNLREKDHARAAMHVENLILPNGLEREKVSKKVRK